MENLKNAAQTKLEISQALLDMGETIRKNGVTPEIARNIVNSAENGDTAAQYMVSMLYRSGLGMEQSLTLSFMWADIAFNAGYEGAQLIQRDVIAQMTDIEVVTAKIMSQNWKPRSQANGVADANTGERHCDFLSTLLDQIPDKSSAHDSINAKMALRFLVDPDSENISDAKHIEDDAAETLALSTRALMLDGLVSLSVTAAGALAKHKSQGLFLRGLTSLSDEAAVALAANNKDDGLALDGVISLSGKAAAGLAQFRGGGLFLNGLTSLSDEAAEGLGQFEGQVLFLNGLTDLSDKAVEFLDQGKQIVVNGQWIKDYVATRSQDSTN